MLFLFFLGVAEVHLEVCETCLSQEKSFPKDGVLAPAALFLAGPQGEVNITGTNTHLLHDRTRVCESVCVCVCVLSLCVFRSLSVCRFVCRTHNLVRLQVLACHFCLSVHQSPDR